MKQLVRNLQSDKQAGWRWTCYSVAVILVVGCIAMFNGCKGNDGPTGPQGPTGNANIRFSAWFTPNPWVKDTVFSQTRFRYTVSDSNITSSILDSGVILTYGKLDGYNTLIWPTNQISQMPISVTYTESATTYTDTWSALPDTDKLTIQFINDKNLYGSISTAHQFRYVIIPGGSRLKAAGVAPLDYRNYEAVKEYYNLPD